MILFVIPFLLPLLQILLFLHQFCWILLIVPVSGFCTFPPILLLGRVEDDHRYKSFTMNFYSGTTPPSLLSSIPFWIISSILSKISIVHQVCLNPYFLSYFLKHTKNIVVVWCCLALRCTSRLRQKKKFASLKHRKLILLLVALTHTAANHLPVMVNKTALATIATCNYIEKKA